MPSRRAASSGVILRFVATSSVRRLLVAYVVLAVLAELVVLFPGGPTYESGWRFVGWVAFEALLVWLLWHRSRIAWAVLVVLTLISVLFVLVSPADFASLLVSF